MSPVNYETNLLKEKGVPVMEGFEYNSGTNPVFLSIDELRKINETCG